MRLVKVTRVFKPGGVECALMAVNQVFHSGQRSKSVRIVQTAWGGASMTMDESTDGAMAISFAFFFFYQLDLRVE